MTPYSYADISTVHIQQHDTELLTRICSSRTKYAATRLLVVAEYEQGYFLTLSDKEWLDEISPELLTEGFSTEFITLLGMVIERGFTLLRLDADGEYVDELPQFDW